MIENILNVIGNSLSDWLLLPLLVSAAIWFTIRFRGVQFTLFGDMCRQLITRGNHSGISSFQAFAVSPPAAWAQATWPE